MHDDRHAWAHEIAVLAVEVEPRAGGDGEPWVRRPGIFAVERRRGVAIRELAIVQLRELIALECDTAGEKILRQRLRETDVAEDRVAPVGLAVAAEPARPPLARHRRTDGEEHARVEHDAADGAEVAATRVGVIAVSI